MSISKGADPYAIPATMESTQGLRAPHEGAPAAPQDSRRFWGHVWAIKGSVTLIVLPRVLAVGAAAAVVTVAKEQLGSLSLAVGPVELVGGALVLLLVLRTNAGYERWWEARKLWGGIVNQSRNLAIAAAAFVGDREWVEVICRWTALFPHVARRSLRGERDVPEAISLVGSEVASPLTASEHMPTAVAREIAALLRSAVTHGVLSEFAFLQCDRERALLIDHVGACERILKTPLPLVYVIKVRRFIALYLFVLPFALVDKVGWAAPLLTMLVAYPIFGLDQIAVELENPFSKRNLSHLPLDGICQTIERNVLSLMDAPRLSPAGPSVQA